MIALTQKNREELKAFLSASIENRCTVYTLAKQRELEALRDQIALASLTAEVFGYVGEDAIEAGEELFSTTLYAGTEDLLDYSGDKKPAPLYLAPPVQEIKFPEKPDYSGEFTSFKDPVAAYKDGVVDGHRWYEKALKRLNGLGE